MLKFFEYLLYKYFYLPHVTVTLSVCVTGAEMSFLTDVEASLQV